LKKKYKEDKIMGWSEHGRLPVYAEQTPHFGAIGGASLTRSVSLGLLGGYQSVSAGEPLSASQKCWRSDNGIEWRQITTNLSNSHANGIGAIRENVLLLGGGAQPERGKVTNAWTISPTESTTRKELQFGGAGRVKDNRSLFNSGEAFWYKGHGRQGNLGGWLMGKLTSPLGTLPKIWFKKEIRKGGGNWIGGVNGDELPRSLNLPGVVDTVDISNRNVVTYAHWTATVSNVRYFFLLAYDGSSPVIGGAPGYLSIYRSRNGFQWTKIAPWNTLPIEIATWGAGTYAQLDTGTGSTMFLVGGKKHYFNAGGTEAYSRKIWTSANGINWIQHPDLFPVDIEKMSACIFRENGYDVLLVAGGRAGSTQYNKVWRLQLS
jgi:hypothetical protein